jgi:hypothetical protein
MNLKEIIRAVAIPATITAYGISLNRLVCHFNAGMPVPDIFSQNKWVSLTPDTLFPELADILPGYYSIGDILIYAGLLLFVFNIFKGVFYDNLSRDSSHRSEYLHRD